MFNDKSTITEPHPTTPNVEEFLTEYRFRVYDTLLAVALSICTVVGLPSNIVSLIYFYSGRRRDFSSFTYILVCCIDICTCVAHLPVMISLYNLRRPVVFAEALFCISWSVVFYYLQGISMFLVMLLSVSRSIKLINTYHRINKKALLYSFILYTVFHLILYNVPPVVGNDGSMFYGYSRVDVYCYYELYAKPLSYIDQLIHSIVIGIAPTVTTVSFTIFVIVLFRKSRVSQKNNKKHRAAVTMAMFSALFLTCNIPCLLNNILWFLTELSYKREYPEPFYSGDFMFFYSWLISDVFCTVLNATLNPVLYFCRIEGLKRWFKRKLRGTLSLSKNNIRSMRLSVISVVSTNWASASI
ncbi:hypothetical protein ACHWQZ_G015206 [Mnemiopsis leidyi]